MGGRRRGEDGFTLIELMVTLSIGAVLVGLAGSGLATWSSTASHKGARDQTISALRVTAQRALSEGRTYCLAFGTNGSWRTYRTACTTAAGGVAVGNDEGVASAGETVAASFTYGANLQSACPTAGRCAYFYPRGTAAGGTVTLARVGKPTYTVVVEQLTSRVYTN